jgi:hypothetical protein
LQFSGEEVKAKVAMRIREVRGSILISSTFVSFLGILLFYYHEDSFNVMGPNFTPHIILQTNVRISWALEIIPRSYWTEILLWYQYYDWNNHNTSYHRAIARFKHQKMARFEVKSGPRNKYLASSFEKINALKR